MITVIAFYDVQMWCPIEVRTRINLYISPVFNVVESFGVNQQQYADYAQLFMELAATTTGTAVKKNRGLR